MSFNAGCCTDNCAADCRKHCDDDCKKCKRGPRGKRGERGKRGKRGHQGHDGTSGIAPLIGAARVLANGTILAQKGFAGITHVPGTGVYNLTLATTPVDSDLLAVEITQAANGIPGVGGQETAGFVSAGVVAAITFDSAGTPTDRGFMITVYDLNP